MKLISRDGYPNEPVILKKKNYKCNTEGIVYDKYPVNDNYMMQLFTLCRPNYMRPKRG